MNISIRGKQMEVTDALKDYVIKRVGKLEKYSDEFKDVKVTLLVEEGRHRVEVTAPLQGMILRGEEESGDMYASIDAAVDTIEQQIRKNKTRLEKKLREGAFDRELMAEPVSEEPEDEFKVVRTKRFSIKPMTVDEAILQMNLLGHEFFMFRNADDDDGFAVVYRRNDGGYGLIESSD